MAEENRGGAGRKILIAIVILAIVAAAGYFLVVKRTNLWSKKVSVVDSSKYQAVFLTNGQTYFGKVVNPNDKYVSLSDVYYLVLKQPLQSQNNTDQVQNQDQAKPEYNIIKLGKEMHGPTSMSINKDQILFIENLSDDSKVVSAIKNNPK